MPAKFAGKFRSKGKNVTVTQQITYRKRQAMPGTDDYGWYVEVRGTDGRWYNFFGNRPLTERQAQRAVSNLGKIAQLVAVDSVATHTKEAGR